MMYFYCSDFVWLVCVVLLIFLTVAGYSDDFFGDDKNAHKSPVVFLDAPPLSLRSRA